MNTMVLCPLDGELFSYIDNNRGSCRIHPVVIEIDEEIMFSIEFENQMISLQEDFLYSVDAFSNDDLLDIACDFQSAFCSESL